MISSNTLYGTASGGGSSGCGTVFKVNTNGTGFSTLYSFTGGDDGGNPEAGLILSGNSLYGTAEYGGDSGRGTVFKVNTDGTGFSTLYSFTGGDDGGNPLADLILSGNTLYGTASGIYSSSDGTVFKVNTDGTGFSTLYSFTGGADGANPEAGLVLSGNTLYGTASGGGTSGCGTVFKVNTDGSALLSCMASRPLTPTLTPTATGLIRPDCFYRATRCMGRRFAAEVQAMARRSKSTPMARASRSCIVSRQRLPLLLLPPTVMEFVRKA